MLLFSSVNVQAIDNDGEIMDIIILILSLIIGLGIRCKYRYLHGCGNDCKQGRNCRK